MEYVFRFLFGFLVTWAGYFVAVYLMGWRLQNGRRELAKLRELRTRPEPYIWVDVGERRPTENQEYLVEYHYAGPVFDRFHAVYRYDVSQERFEPEGFNGIIIDRWAKLPR